MPHTPLPTERTAAELVAAVDALRRELAQASVAACERIRLSPTERLHQGYLEGIRAAGRLLDRHLP